MWLARLRSENHSEKKRSHPQRRGARRNPSSGLKEESPPPSDRMAPFASELLLEHGFGFRKANVVTTKRPLTKVI